MLFGGALASTGFVGDRLHQLSLLWVDRWRARRRQPRRVVARVRRRRVREAGRCSTGSAGTC